MHFYYCAGINSQSFAGVRAGVDIDIAGAGGSVTHTLRVRAVMVRNSAGAGGSGMKKTVPRRALDQSSSCFSA